MGIFHRRFIMIIGIIAVCDSVPTDKAAKNFQEGSPNPWESYLCSTTDSLDPTNGYVLERHSSNTSHGDLCRSESGEYSCPLLGKGPKNRQACTLTDSGKAPFCEMQESRSGRLIPCRAQKAPREWIARRMQDGSSAATHEQTRNKDKENRWSKCVKQRGFTKGGHWVRSQNSIPGSGCKSVKSTSWLWHPITVLCQFTPLSANAFCEAAKRANIKHIVFVGDSLMRRTRTRTNTNPTGTEANAAGRSGNSRALREQSKCGMSCISP